MNNYQNMYLTAGDHFPNGSQQSIGSKLSPEDEVIVTGAYQAAKEHMKQSNLDAQAKTLLELIEKDKLDPKTSKEGKLKLCSKALHPEFSYPLVDVAEMSIEKGYKPYNWLDKNTPVTLTYLIEAAQRHLDKLKLGIDINTEEKTLSGEPTKNQPSHFAAVAFNMLMADLQIRKGVQIDDRLFTNGELRNDK